MVSLPTAPAPLPPAKDQTTTTGWGHWWRVGANAAGGTLQFPEALGSGQLAVLLTES